MPSIKPKKRKKMEDHHNKGQLTTNGKVSDFWKKIAIFFLCLILAKPYLSFCIGFVCGYLTERLLIFYVLWARILFKSKNKIKFAIASYALFILYLNIALLGELGEGFCEEKSVFPVIIFEFLCRQ